MASEFIQPKGPEKAGPGMGVKIVIGVIVIIVVIVAGAILTLSVAVTNPELGAAYPYSTKYAVSFPEGQQIAVGNTKVSVLSYQNELVTDVEGNRQKLVVGEDRVLAERGATITTLGITILQTNFQINLTYTGERSGRAYFDMTINTQKQVPELILKGLLPPAIEAQAV
jgi:hypothetical protein